MHTSTTSTGRLEAWSAEQLQSATQGYWLQARVPDAAIQRIVTNSRDATTGDAFLALKGERFDAHDFVVQVAAQGASCLIVQRAIDGLDIPQLIVANTRKALADLGAYRRQQCQNLQVIALTGSSGKTTTKEMLGSIFSRLGSTLVTRGNLNNDLGVPMMLLELRSDHRYAVLELGASHQGEIDYTAQLVQADVAGILNIGTAHLGEFGGREGIFRAKSEIYSHINAHGCAIIPAADRYAAAIQQLNIQMQHSSFGEGGDVYAQNIQLQPQSSQFELITPQGQVTIQLPFAGMHNVHNAEAAACFALALGVQLPEIAQGLAMAQTAQGRLNFIRKKNYLLIDDTYNANPNSMRAAADVLLQQSGIKVMVIGDIGELGEAAEAEHFKLGQDLAQKPIDYIVAVGEFAETLKHGANTSHVFAFATQQQAVDALYALINKHLAEPLSFLFKGSRYTHMEKALMLLMEKI